MPACAIQPHAAAAVAEIAANRDRGEAGNLNQRHEGDRGEVEDQAGEADAPEQAGADRERRDLRAQRCGAQARRGHEQSVSDRTKPSRRRPDRPGWSHA